MPKFPTFPILYDEVLQLHISKLKQWGYLEPGQIKRGTVTWSSNGKPTGNISIMANTEDERPYVLLNFKYGEDPRNYKIHLVSIPANLGKGKIWYFLCPETHKRCRKLYSVGGYFLHRTAFKGCMYQSQTQSKKWREMEKIYGAYFDSDKIYRELHKKNFKKYYAGKPTKKYLRLLKQLRKSEAISVHDIERLMVEGI